MIATLGSMVTVMIYPTAADRDMARNGREVQAVITSAGPPGVVADWARTTGPDARWLPVRKPKNTAGGHRYEAILNDPGIK